MIKNYISLLLFFSFYLSQAQNPLVNVNVTQASAVCMAGNCTTLIANFPEIRSTESYQVNAISYNPFLYDQANTTYLPLTNDDLWAPAITIPFNFCFYGIPYSSIQVGSNGVVSFNANYTSTEACAYDLRSTAIPNTEFPIKNAIYGVYQDLDFTRHIAGSGNINYYILDSGQYAAPNRIMVINFNKIPTYTSNFNPPAVDPGFQTSQIVLHETTNIIDINIQHRYPDLSWQDGEGVIGIQNTTGSSGSVPEGRNTGAWIADNESWRFTPNGITLLTPQFSWFSPEGSLVGTGDTVNVCPASLPATYVVNADLINCAGMAFNLMKPYTITSGRLPAITNPEDIMLCNSDSPVYNVDLTQNEVVMLNGSDPQGYIFSYYTTLAAANNGFSTDSISNPAMYVFNGSSQPIFIRIEDGLGSGCHDIRHFNLGIYAAAQPPIGAPEQYFTPGQTLNDLNVSGTNIIWFDAAAAGNLLPGNTPLQNAATYYAESGSDSCETKQNAAERLAVTVFVTLAVSDFGTSSLKVFPNPANEVLNISYRDNLDHVEIYNAVGQLVSSSSPKSKETKIDLSTVSSGVYFVKLSSGNTNTIAKIVKN